MREIARSILLIGLSVLLNLADPFGATSALRHASQNAYFSIMSPAYGQRPSSSPLVLLAGDEDVANLQTTWPLPMSVHAEVLQELASSGARAILIDFVFWDERGAKEIESFRDAILDVAETTRILIPDPRDSGRQPSPLLEEVFYLPLSQAPGVEFVSIRSGTERNRTSSMPVAPRAPGMLPASAKMQSIYCDGSPATCSDGIEAQFIELIWPAPPFACQQANAPSSCGSAPSSPLEVAGTLLLSSVFSGLGAGSDWPVDGLYPFETASVSQLLLSGLPPDRLQGRFVFYGGNFTGIADHVTAPYYGELPGVFAHAAAFDNQVILGSRSYRDELPLGLTETAYVILAITVLVIVLQTSRIARTLVFPGRVRSLMVDGLTVYAAGIIVAAIEAAYLRTSPEHWLLTPTLLSASLGPVDFFVRKIWPGQPANAPSS